MLATRVHLIKPLFVYQVFKNCQCLNDLRVRIYDLVTFTTWLSYKKNLASVEHSA